MPSDMAATAVSAATGDHSNSTSIQGNKHPTRQTTDPIDKSIPPVTMTNAAPMEMIPNKALRRIRFSMLNSVRKRSLRIAVMTQINTSKPKIPRIFFMRDYASAVSSVEPVARCITFSSVT